MRRCKEHSKTIYHVFDGLSRDRLERYIFSLTDDAFSRVVHQAAEGRDISEENLRSIASFCRYFICSARRSQRRRRQKHAISEKDTCVLRRFRI